MTANRRSGRGKTTTTSSVSPVDDQETDVRKELDLMFLWATPRSVSTAFERCIASSKLVNIIHEPFTETYYFGPERRSSRYGDIADAAQAETFTASRVNGALCEAGRRQRSFVKELAYLGEPYIDDDLLSRARHVFITRHPAKAAASLRNLKPDFTEDEFGYAPLKRIFERCSRYHKDLRVIDGDAFRASPKVVLRTVCGWMNIPFEDGMVTWENGAMRQWRKYERRWHRTLENSKGILPPEQHTVVHFDGRLTCMIKRAEKFFYDLMEYSMLDSAMGTP